MYYDYFTHHAHKGVAKGKTITVPAALNQVPLFIRGGSIITTRERPRRSSTLMKRDPFTLRVALDKSGSASGELYLDDGETYDHQQGQFVWRGLRAEKPSKRSKTIRLSSKDLATEHLSMAVDSVALKTFDPLNQFAKSIDDVRVEKVIVMGLSSKPTSVKVEGGDELVWKYIPGVAAGDKKEGVASLLVIKDPKVLVIKDWAINIEL